MPTHFHTLHLKERSEMYSLVGNEAKAKEDAERAEELMPTDGKENAEENI